MSAEVLRFEGALPRRPANSLFGQIRSFGLRIHLAIWANSNLISTSILPRFNGSPEQRVLFWIARCNCRRALSSALVCNEATVASRQEPRSLAFRTCHMVMAPSVRLLSIAINLRLLPSNHMPVQPHFFPARIPSCCRPCTMESTAALRRGLFFRAFSDSIC